MKPHRHCARACMRRLAFCTVTVSLAVSATCAFAAGQVDFQAAYAAAEHAEQQAAKLHDQWTPTEAALKQAKKTAANNNNYDAAITLARQAEELAKTSIAQAQAQETAWHGAVVH